MPGDGSSAAPQQRAQARLELAQREGLDEVVVGPGVEAGDAIVDRLARGQHQHRCAVTRIAQPPADLQPVDRRASRRRGRSRRQAGRRAAGARHRRPRRAAPRSARLERAASALRTAGSSSTTRILTASMLPGREVVRGLMSFRIRAADPKSHLCCDEGLRKSATVGQRDARLLRQFFVSADEILGLRLHLGGHDHHHLSPRDRPGPHVGLHRPGRDRMRFLLVVLVGDGEHDLAGRRAREVHAVHARERRRPARQPRTGRRGSAEHRSHQAPGCGQGLPEVPAGGGRQHQRRAAAGVPGRVREVLGVHAPARRRPPGPGCRRRPACRWRGIDQSDPKVQAATKACQDKLPQRGGRPRWRPRRPRRRAEHDEPG